MKQRSEQVWNILLDNDSAQEGMTILEITSALRREHNVSLSSSTVKDIMTNLEADGYIDSMRSQERPGQPRIYWYLTPEDVEAKDAEDVEVEDDSEDVDDSEVVWPDEDEYDYCDEDPEDEEGLEIPPGFHEVDSAEIQRSLDDMRSILDGSNAPLRPSNHIDLRRQGR